MGNPGSEVAVWLSEHGLTEFAPKFQRLGYQTLETLTMLRDDLFSGDATIEANARLEITSFELPPGFRRMFEAGLRKLTAGDAARCFAAADDSTKPTTTTTAAAAAATTGHNKIEKISGFYCPITLDLMKDPVIDREGNTFERKAIEDWIRLHGTSPITRQPAMLDDLRPNRSLQESIKMEMALEGITVPSLSSPATTPRNAGPAAPRPLAGLSLGDIVTIGPDWQWDDQNGGPEGRGVVMSEVGADSPGWVKVLWVMDLKTRIAMEQTASLICAFSLQRKLICLFRLPTMSQQQARSLQELALPAALIGNGAIKMETALVSRLATWAMQWRAGESGIVAGCLYAGTTTGQRTIIGGETLEHLTCGF